MMCADQLGFLMMIVVTLVLAEKSATQSIKSATSNLKYRCVATLLLQTYHLWQVLFVTLLRVYQKISIKEWQISLVREQKISLSPSLESCTEKREFGIRVSNSEALHLASHSLVQLWTCILPGRVSPPPQDFDMTLSHSMWVVFCKWYNAKFSCYDDF